MSNVPARPLLVIDGDTFARRSYHGLLKAIRQRDGCGAGVVLVARDTLTAPTARPEALPAYQAGREFDDELVEQLLRLPEFIAACGFANAKASGHGADDCAQEFDFTVSVERELLG